MRFAVFCQALVAVSVSLIFAVVVHAHEHELHSFRRQQLTDVYFSEGASAGDINGDGVVDAVYGPYWFEGPAFEKRHEIFKPVPQDRNRYADHFFHWVYDFDGDDQKDILVAGFPGTPAYIYQNPGSDRLDSHWPKHEVFDWVSNEAPQLIDIVDDERPELICTRDGFFGFVTASWDDPFGRWTFHPISEKVTATRFGHGLGVGDVDGDGRQDLIHAKGWYQQPDSNPTDQRWRHFPAQLSAGYGGAEMYAYDVDGDGDNDIITSDQAHEYGLSWYEQQRDGEEITFQRRQIMGSHPSENRYGVVFTEPHSVALVDLDGDGLKDIVTGKTYWSHHKQSPMWDTGAVVYWFRLTRGADGVDWVPYQLDDQAGIGRQISVIDVNDDQLLDIVVGGMKGGHVLLHQQRTVSHAEWQAVQPKRYEGPSLPKTENARLARGPKSKIDADSGRVRGSIEGEWLQPRVSAGEAREQSMAGFRADKWSGKSQLWWTGAKPGDQLTLPLPAFTGTVDLEVVLTCARDYGIVQLTLDDVPLGDPIDLYDPEVITTGILKFPKLSVRGAAHTLGVQIAGANAKAVKSYMFAIDYLRIRKPDGSYVTVTKPVATQSPSKNEGVEPQTRDGRVLNLGFEDGSLSDWTATGNAFADQPIQGDTVAPRRSGMKSLHAGDFWIGGYEQHGDEPKGTLTSEPFVVSKPYGSFLTNGGDHASTRVELVRTDSGKVFYRVNGNNSESMRRVVVDLRAHAGKEIQVRIVDDHSGGWGHVNFDHFRLHEKRPGRPTDEMVVLTPDEYPHAGLNAQQAVAAMNVPEGFQVSVGAAEPDVKQPIAMALDDRGRVWIAEAYEYPVRASGDAGRDRILIFEDTDGDGSLDKQKVFAEGLNLVSGLEVGFGGVWVGAAPYLMFIPDRDGDDQPDAEPEILLDGWGYQDTHETLNAFIWGPDGWLYGCHGVFTHSLVGKPGTPNDKRVPLNCGVWRYHPIRHEFEVFAHGTSNPWGVDFNDQGQAFITACVIPHLYHIIQGARYQRQGGQHFNPFTYRDIVTIADHLHYLGATPHSGNSKSDSAGGGHAHAGAMIYLGDQWPETYRNQLFMNNIHGQRLNVESLNPNDSGYIGSHRPDFLLTGDQASQILNLRYGPDGNAWMIDWYDMQACHRREVEQHDRSNGRIYKITYGDSETSAPSLELATASDLQLADLVLHQNDWYVRHARRVLQERAASGPIDQDAIDRLKQLLSTHRDETRRLRAAWTLHVIGELTEPDFRKMWSDAGPYVRGWGVQLAMESSEYRPTDEQLQTFTEMAGSDDSAIVRLYLASAAQLVPLPKRLPLLRALTSHAEDADDHNLPLMYWYAAEPLAGLDTMKALEFGMAAGEKIPVIREFMLRRIGSGNAEASLAVLVQGLRKVDRPALQLTYLKAIRESLKGVRRASAPKGWSSASKELLASSDDAVRLQAIALGVTFGDASALNVMRQQVSDDQSSTTDRLVALRSLLDANDAGLVSTLVSLLGDQDDLSEAAIRGLAQYDDPAVAPALLQVYGDLTPVQKRMALGTLSSRVGSGEALLKAIEAKKIPGADLTADLVRQLQFHDSKSIEALLKNVWGTVRKSAEDKLRQIEEYTTLVQSNQYAEPDLQLGRAVFAKTCMKCHKLYGEGYKIGPDLTGSNRSNLEYLLSNIVDPSSVMAKEYLPTNILTVDGRVVSGLIQEEDEQSITLQTTDALVVIPKDEIEQRIQAKQSMMPEDQLKQFSPHEIRSLIGYLRTKQQTPMLATRDNVSTLFNGNDLTGWSGTEGLWSVEAGELVGRSEGLQNNEWIVSDLSADDFRLTLEVKLVDNAGNSGIQFRSRAENGEVSGYQADIGEGWWGKLYEEHGRGLLSSPPEGEAEIRSGDWNTYEIVAVSDHVRTYINGQPCIDLKDAEGARRGIIALQLHSGGPTEVRFRNLRLELIE